jgi:hypothetical protein
LFKDYRSNKTLCSGFSNKCITYEVYPELVEGRITFIPARPVRQGFSFIASVEVFGNRKELCKGMISVA